MPQPLACGRNGRIFNFPRLEAVGMKAGRMLRLKASDLIRLPPGSEIFVLPRRLPVAYDPAAKNFIQDNKHFAAAAFLSPGYTVTYNGAYKEMAISRALPLFSYAACSFYKGEIYVTAVRVDKSLCHDSRFMDMRLVRKNAAGLKKLFTKNRLVRHLENCALSYGCPNAKNFFLSKYEAPLPTSPACNAQCLGCISYQLKTNRRAAQPRIEFIPTPEEIAEIALFHIENVEKPVVSFGQGCEGEPLLCVDTIKNAIKLIRARTSKGVINMNTNGSDAGAISKIFDAGLDSIRVSLNSAREIYYKRYYKPRGYSFKDVLKSINTAKRRRGFVSINYLTMPGFTDSEDEFAVFKKFVAKNKIDMIQWRNLNYDPLRYFEELKISVDTSKMLGVKEVISYLQKEFPYLKMGYFNVSK